MKQSIKKFTCALLATVSAFGSAAMLTACETSHPTVEMEISFNGKTYEIEYKLYRKTAPATVEHFLYLAGNGYYDGLCVHNYVKDDRLYTGEYFATEGGELEQKNYFQEVASYSNAFPHSVWEDAEKTKPTYTLKGEFAQNNFEVETGALQEQFGSLAMYYYEESEAKEMRVYCASASEEGQTNRVQYQNNLATSTFFISLKSTKTTNNNYCTFATVTENGKEELKALQTAINNYVSKNYSDDDEEFTHSLSKQVFENNAFLKDYKKSVSFNVPNESIIIEKVSVTKY